MDEWSLKTTFFGIPYYLKERMWLYLYNLYYLYEHFQIPHDCAWPDRPVQYKIDLNVISLYYIIECINTQNTFLNKHYAFIYHFGSYVITSNGYSFVCIRNAFSSNKSSYQSIISIYGRIFVAYINFHQYIVYFFVLQTET